MEPHTDLVRVYIMKNGPEENALRQASGIEEPSWLCL